MSETLIEQLAQSFKRFPGIGPRQAKRFVHYLLRASQGEVDKLLNEIRNLRSNIKTCAACRRFFSPNGIVSPLCPICRHPERDHTLLMLVEKDIDLDNIERSGTYRGYYFVLGGLLPILEKNPEQKLPLRDLVALVNNKLKETETLREIIVALSANLEGDHTIEFLKTYLTANLPATPGIKISTLGRGLSTGAELEYSDPDTLKNALKHRE